MGNVIGAVAGAAAGMAVGGPPGAAFGFAYGATGGTIAHLEIERNNRQAREAEARRIREAEAQRAREAEARRIREAEAQRAREAEEQRVREAEAQRAREAEEQRAREEAARREAADLAAKQNDYYSAKRAADQEKSAFESLANSMTSYKTQKNTAESAASTKVNALNSSINNLNTQKTEVAKLEAVKLAEVTAGTHTDFTFNSSMLNITRIPPKTFTPAVDPSDFSAVVNSGRSSCNALNTLSPNVYDKSALINAKNQASSYASSIRSAKATLEAAKNKYIQGKAHADSKAAEFQQETERNNTEHVAQVRSTQETKNEIKLNIIDKINIQDSHGETPLIKAAKQGNYVAINYIFENMSPEQINHISFEAKDSSGKTALHYLVEKSMQAEANKFITNGASPYIPDAEGKTAYDLASDNAMEDLCNLMRETFGDPPSEVSLPSDLAAYIEANRAEENAERDEDLLSAITDLSDVVEGVQDIALTGQIGTIE